LIKADERPEGGGSGAEEVGGRRLRLEVQIAAARERELLMEGFEGI
jgi:hypothetical protein